MKKMAFRAIAAAVLVLSSTGLASADYTFNFVGVTFVQGSSAAGTLSGTFSTNNALTALTSANITASPAGPLTGGFTFPGHNYTLVNSSTAGTSLPSFFQLTDGSYVLQIRFTGGLTTSGATITPGSSFESEPGGGNRTVATGSVQAVPEPSSLALCGIAGAVGLGVARARRKRAAI